MTISTMVRDAQNRAFAAEVKRRMNDLGISSPVALAQRMDMKSNTALYNILKGRSRAARKTVARIAEALEMDQAVLRKLLTATPDLSTPPEDRERAIVFEDDPPAPKVTSEVHALREREVLHALRERLGMKQPEFAALVGVSPKTLSRWENGHSVPTEIALRRIEQIATGQAAAPAPPSRFSLTMEPGGTMRLTLDIGGVSTADAFKLVDQIRLAGLFGHAEG